MAHRLQRADDREVKFKLTAFTPVKCLPIDFLRCRLWQICGDHLGVIEWCREPQDCERERLLALLIEQQEPGRPVERGHLWYELIVESGERLRPGLIESRPEAGKDFILPKVSGPDVDEPERIRRYKRQIGGK